MITRRTKVQLLFFVLITLIGVSYVGARYARLDRLVLDNSYTVVAHFPDSGGIFTGAGVTYRGVTIGQVSRMDLTDQGVDVHLDIENDWDEIPAETVALVANKSAVGEQYVDLQPKVDEGPFLDDDSEIEQVDTRIPIPTAKLLEDISTTVADVDKDALRTVVSEFGLAFDGTGESLGQIIDTSNSFIETANENFDVTRSLIRDGNVVLRTQLDKASAIRNFSTQLAKFSTTVAASDKDIRKVIDAGSPAANELRRFIDDNDVELASLINNLVTTGEIVVEHLDGIEQLLVLYPYVVEGGFTVVSKDPQTGKFDAHFGLIDTAHELCHRGYDENADKRGPQNLGDRPLPTDVRCAESPAESNPRGAQNAPRAAADYDAPVAYVDRETGEVSWLDSMPGLQVPGSVAPRTSTGVALDREESWKWALLQPLTAAPK
ncbi:MCE family protein [Nocardioides donggukensis]|uniref:MCE family protein n=1 Tax=Nocardioides donggukensis TaxID=2774019 RepID=A0A927Q0J9_9ACTN|nr:MlaD family protein [Nocardioides donggukensis]MBD8870735.1 MCE family protein [Nocardioides donggukensis]